MIKCAYTSTIERVIETVPQSRRSVLVRKVDKWPILESIGIHQAPYIRALVTVVLGCDVLKGGVKGIGPATVHTFIMENIPIVEAFTYQLERPE